MRIGGFRVLYTTEKYPETIEFWRDGIGLPIINSWDGGPELRGTEFRASTGVIEVMAYPVTTGEDWEVYSPNTPRGLNIAVEVTDVHAAYANAQAKNLRIKNPLADYGWGHLGFSVWEPNGAIVFFYNLIT